MTKSLSNLLKRGSIVNKDERVIDYNEIIQKKIEALSESYARRDEDGFVNGLDADYIDYDDYENDEDIDSLLEDGEEYEEDYSELTADVDEELQRLYNLENMGFDDDVSPEERDAILQTREKRKQALLEKKEELIEEARKLRGKSKPKERQARSASRPTPNITTESLAQINKQSEEILAAANEEAERILEEARQMAEGIVNEANEETEAIKNDAAQSGYNDGCIKAEAKIEEMRQELDNEYEQRKEELEREYEEKKANIEPELVDILTDVFKKVTLTVAEDNQEIIMHLINGVMRNADSSHNFIIKVSPDDYKFLINNQGKLYVAMSKEVNIDILEDPTMKRNECIIETDTGVFNCGLDIELDNLIKDLKLLSCI
ncbi:FliH/SctL family protein [Lachnospira pectinoschiza]|uniref:Flagellar biosynthesis/type III secretory pathway protein FliH n=1 Tax=Lachnospira pectinoschiza TaxID=28052 RepID=A0A1G9Z8F0_9FIRM|nr:FliH/SctL family protein [Lachnospira pectinoschiza]SDN17425.1 Flagellar biosynthesis/type III secretory pathway protein FliH [Lachnospira pectinoschiza]